MKWLPVWIAVTTILWVIALIFVFRMGVKP